MPAGVRSDAAVLRRSRLFAWSGHGSL